MKHHQTTIYVTTTGQHAIRLPLSVEACAPAFNVSAVLDNGGYQK